MNKHIESKLKEFEEGLYKEFWKEGGMSATDFAKDFLQKALEDIYQKGREDEAYEVTKPINLDDYFDYTRWPEGRF